ncbi:MAG: fumarylacetoacetate hydrolase family protein [Bacteroidota bacterium]
MKLYKTSSGIVITRNDQCYLLPDTDWDTFINDDELYQKMNALIHTVIPSSKSIDTFEVLAPLESQELWACGVTYLRSKVGRQEESSAAGGSDFYARVYEAERPEVFFKSTPHRVVGHGAKVNIRKDSTWDVPEPELTLVVSSSGKILGYTIGNDMSSRSIEGENPLYLPQAKTYDACAAVGPCIYVPGEPIQLDTKISLTINRKNKLVFEGTVQLNQMKRTPEELVSFVYRACSFPKGCLIMTGTGIVPPNDFTLLSGDEISISIDHIGTLYNTVR